MSGYKNDMKLCDRDCNKCPLVLHHNARMVSRILNLAYKKFGDEFYAIVQDNCPNLTCCYDCNIDDFNHLKNCKIVEE